MHAVLGLNAQRTAATAALAVVVVVAGSSVPVQAIPSSPTSKVIARAPISPQIFALSHTSTGQPWAMFLRTHGNTDGYVVQNDFQTDQSTGWHSHPGPSLIFVVSGSVTNYASDQPNCQGVTYSAGTSFVDQGGTDVHELVNTGGVPAQTIAVQFIPQGMDKRVPQPEPANCHV